jgi:hypothetical protein
MATVTIRGSIMPSAFLPRGQEVTVQRTEQIDALIRQGFVDVIAEHDDATPEGKVVSPEPPAPASDEPKHPAKNARREDWAEFLATTPLADKITDQSRDQLVGLWEAYVDEHPDAG